MRHRIKKIPNLISKYKSLHHRLLHSDKSACDTYGNNTYFYKTKYFLKQHFPYSKPKTIPLAVPAMSMFAFLLVLGLMVFPAGGRAVMALDGDTTGEEDDGLNLSLEITSPTVEGTIGTNKDGSVSAAVGEPSYGGVKLTTTATGINPHTGYSIYIQSTDKDLSLVNDIDSSYRINPISDSTNLAKGEIPENEWGYAIEQGDTASYASMSYKPIAASGDVSIPAIHGTNELNNTPFILAFGANIGKDKLAGHYRTNVLVSLVAEAKSVVTYNLIYNGNGNTGGNAPETATADSKENSYEFTVAGKGTLEKTDAEFLGWATTANAIKAEYTEGDTITLYRKIDEAEPTSSQTLYAVWKSIMPPIDGTITTPFSNFTYMQDPGLKDYCQNSNTPDKTSGQLVDGRDGKIYWVTVLGSGSDKTCWMTQDLDLDLGPDGPTLTTENTGDNLYKGSDTAWDGGRSVTSSSNNWTTNTYKNVNWWERDKIHGTDHASLGNLYSYQAATAGTGSSITTDGSKVPGSICPAGWKLPIGGNALTNKGIGSFNSLEMSNSTITRNPYYFQRGGNIEGSFDNIDYEGGYWSATSRNNNTAYSLRFNTSNFFTGGDRERYVGYSVRCVIR